MRQFTKSMHCILEGEASIIHFANLGSRTADTLSFCSLAPGGMAQGITKVPAEKTDKRFLSSEKDRHAIVQEPHC